MFRKAGKLIDKLPLAGIIASEPALKGYIKSELGNERRKFTGVSALLGVYVLGHAYQAKMGVDAFTYHMQHFEGTGDANDALFMGIDTICTAVNTAVTLRQASLMNTASKIRQRRHIRAERLQTRMQMQETVQPALDLGLSDEAPQSDKIPDNETKEKNRAKTSFYKRRLGAVGLALAVTGGGQVAMLVSYRDAMIDHAHNTCITQADDSLTIMKEQHEMAAVGDLEAYREKWIDYCGVSPSDIPQVFPQTQASNVATQR